MLVAVSFDRGIEDAWTTVITFVPKFVGFLVILLVGFFVAKAVSKILNKVLERVGFDRAVERGGVKRALERSRYDASDIVARVAFWAIFLFVLQMAFGVFGPNPISGLLSAVIAFLPKLFVAIVIVVIASAIAAAAKQVVEATLGGLSYGRMLANLASGAILVVGIFAALNQLQIAPTIVTGLFYALLAIVVGSAIVAIGGSGIGPLRERWERALARLDEEAPAVREQVQARGANRSRSAAGAAGSVASEAAATREGGSPRPSGLAAASSSQAPGALPPPGWYQDARDERRLRYWDGTRWTDQTTSG